MGHDVFICHSSDDKVVADAVCAGLEAAGVRCWIAPRDITPGQHWDEAIVEAIEGSKVVVLIFSHHSNGSNQVTREIRNAVAAGATVIPFRLEDLPLSKALKYHLAGSHWLDAVTPPIQAHISRLAETIQRLLGRQPLRPVVLPTTRTVASQLPSQAQTIAPVTSAHRPLVASWVVVFSVVVVALVGFLTVTAIFADPMGQLLQRKRLEKGTLPTADSLLLRDEKGNLIVVPNPVRQSADSASGHPQNLPEHPNPPGSAVAAINAKMNLAREQKNNGDYTAAMKSAVEAVQDADVLARRYPNSNWIPLTRARDVLREVAQACALARSNALQRGTPPPTCK